jgi:hypothetical protein
MFIVTAHNTTDGNGTRPDGTADYNVWVGINQDCIWKGAVTGHLRARGAAALLRKIAAQMKAKPN